MNALADLLLYNVGASLLSGLWVLAVVLLVVRMLRIQSAELRTHLLAIPLLKSTLVLFGLCTVMPIPATFWSSVQDRAVSFESLGPFLLIAVGLGIISIRSWRRRRVSALTAGSEPLREEERAAAISRGVVERLARASRTGLCCRGYRLGERLSEPRLFRTERNTLSTMVAHNPPSVLLPAALERELDDDELEAVLAHELAHVALDRPSSCWDPRWLRALGWLSPGGWTVSHLLATEEELACDEIAVRATGNPDALASALIKSYKLQRRTGGFEAQTAFAGLLGRPGGGLQKRLRRLIDDEPKMEPANTFQAFLAWTIVITLSFLQT